MLSFSKYLGAILHFLLLSVELDVASLHHLPVCNIQCIVKMRLTYQRLAGCKMVSVSFCVTRKTQCAFALNKHYPSSG